MRSSRKILFVGRVHERGQALAESREDVDIDVYEGRDPAEIRRRIADADAIVVRTAVIDRPVIDAAPPLAIISRHGVGFDAVDIEAAAERSIPVTITPLANSVSVAEHAMLWSRRYGWRSTRCVTCSTASTGGSTPRWW